MDFNQMPLGFGFAYVADNMANRRFMDLSDDEKKEYIERNRSTLSKSELDRMKMMDLIRAIRRPCLTDRVSDKPRDGISEKYPGRRFADLRKNLKVRST